jgi:hypothetical protein
MAEPASAAPGPHEQRAIALLKEYAASQSRTHEDQMREILGTHSVGPDFVDAALALVAKEPANPWAEVVRNPAILRYARTAMRRSLPWPDFADSALKKSIHGSARVILMRFEKRGRDQELILEFFNKLHLWDASDLPLILRPICLNANVTMGYVELFDELFARATPEQKAAVAEGLRQPPRTETALNALLLRSGVALDVEDAAWMIRSFVDDYIDPDPFFHEDFRTSTRRILHERLRSGDATLTWVYDSFRAQPRWTSRGNKGAERQAAVEFLRGLWTGQAVDECESGLRAVGKKPPEDED